MEKKVKGVKKFFAEFKKFITRGNVLDMAVGVIVGGAFTGVVNGLSNYILKPIINFLLALVFGGDGLADTVTYLKKVFVLDANGAPTAEIDLTNSIFIDWGSFISSIINFLLVAFTLFMIIRMINRIREAHDRVKDGLELSEKKAIAKICLEEKVPKREAKKIYAERVEAAKVAKAEEERLVAEKAAAEVAAAEEKAMANTRLLEEIRDLLKNK